MPRLRKIAIVPGKSLGPVRIGMKRAEAKKLGKDDFVSVEYEKGRVVFVSASAGGRVRPILFHKDVFETPAKELLALARRRGDRARELERGTLYVCPKLGVSFWRRADPEALKRELATVDDPAERRVYRADIQRFRRFENVAVFAEGYYEALDVEVETPTASPFLAYAIQVTQRQIGKTDRATALAHIAKSRGAWKPDVVESARAELARSKRKT